MLEKVGCGKNTRRIVCPKCQGHQRVFSGGAIERCDYCDHTGMIYVVAVGAHPTIGPLQLVESDIPGGWQLVGPWNVIVAHSGVELMKNNPAESLKNGRLFQQAQNLYDALQEALRRGLITHADGVLYDNIRYFLGQIDSPIREEPKEETTTKGIQAGRRFRSAKHAFGPRPGMSSVPDSPSGSMMVSPGSDSRW